MRQLRARQSQVNMPHMTINVTVEGDETEPPPSEPPAFDIDPRLLIAGAGVALFVFSQ